MQKKWIHKLKQSEDIIEQILLNRGIAKNNQDEFLNPDFSNGLHDPFLLSGMKEAVERIELAILQNETVGIFADYDADGIPAAAILADLLEAHGLKTFVYIPSRSEGYGLNKKGIDEIKNHHASLMMTVDLGIREIENTKYAQSLGLDVIITDHHEPGDEIPKALTIINPKLKDSKYPFRELSGGGVAFKLAHAMSIKLKKISENDLKWMLDLVSITTICDVVPLVDENRIFAKYGLLVLAKTKRLGLKKLYEVAQIDPTKISTYTVGFQIGPRLNAPGRLNQKQESLDLIRTRDEASAIRLSLELDEINKRRQFDLEKILKEARAMVFDQKLNEKKVICLWDKGWSSGLIGLVAGKLVEEFARPVIILEQGDLISKGSARSIDNFNMVEVLSELDELLESFGGHTKAAGLSIKNEKLDLFNERILAMAELKLKEEDLILKITIDAILNENDLSLDLYDRIQKLEPFGLGNPRPVFALEKIEIENIRLMGKDNTHLKFTINNYDVVGFGMGKYKANIENKEIDLAFTLDENIWNGLRKLQLKIIDLKF
jgi:single-stranded-DNA-specific exonuclease